VKLSGPQKKVRTPPVNEPGTRRMAVSRNGDIRSQSGGRVPKEKSAGTPSSRHGAATGSNRPTISPPVSSR
jgi:hypothetical protein